IDRPLLRASVSTSSLKVGDVAVRLVSAPGITVQGDKLELGNVAVAGDMFQATVSGTLPFSWSPVGLPKDKPMDLELSIARQDLSALTLMTDEVSNIEGEVKGAVKVKGDLEHPVLEGVVEADAETLSLSRVKNSFQNLRAVLELQDSTAVIKELKLGSSEGGTLEGEGKVSLAGLPRSPFDVKLHASGLQLHLVNASGVYGEVFRGSLTGDLRLSRESGRDARLEGEIVASEGGLSLPVQPQASKAPSALRNLPVVLLGAQDGAQPFRFRLGRNFQLIRGGLRATVTDGLYLTGSLSEPEISGTLTFQSGSVRFATQRFRIVPGGVMRVSYSPRRGGRVLLDLSAQTSVYARTGRNGERQRYTITVDLSGPMENPRTTFSSDPPGLSSRQMLAAVGRQAEIEAILRGQDADRILREQLGQAFVGAFVPEITSPIEQAISEALGLEEFAIIYDFGTETHFQITKQLLGRLYFTYRHTLSGPRSEFLWKLAYRIRKRLQLSYSADERHVGTWSIEGRVSF
ncbi:MAG: translocation/assembly module TamB domain-containing protein, partial [Armatimonadota bacterium]